MDGSGRGFTSAYFGWTVVATVQRSGILEVALAASILESVTMRVAHVPLLSGLKLFWDRVTFSRITTIYFIFSVLHCIVQVVFQIQAFMVNAQAATFLSGLIRQGNATSPGFAVLGKDLRIKSLECRVQLYTSTVISSSSIPLSSASLSSTSKSASTETVFTTTTVQQHSALTTISPTGSLSATRTVTITLSLSPTQSATSDSDSDSNKHKRHFPRNLSPQLDIDVSGNATVNVNGLYGQNNIILSKSCLYALNWPVDVVKNTKREDIAFIAFQFWVLGMSLVALLNESIPHIVASLLTHILATAWGGFEIYNTASFHHNFSRLTTEGACGINLLPTYWKDRGDAEIPSVALNAVALLVSSFLSWRLLKSFGWQTFKRVGASRTINRVYNEVLMLSIAIQLALYFIAVAAGVWLDQIYNGSIGHLTTEPTLFKALMITVLVLLVPWLTTGWIAVRKERRIPMMVFLTAALLVLVGWATMFDRHIPLDVCNMAVLQPAGVRCRLLTLITLVLGIICRINFGKGLSRYLNAEEPLPGDDFIPVVPGEKADFEKAEFPSTEMPLPTYSIAFGSGPDVPSPAHMRFAPRQLGPRFYASQEPFDAQLESPSTLTRQDSRSSQQTSAGSLNNHRVVCHAMLCITVVTIYFVF
ncbi:hypothetical protein A0H81_00460 [Grifola frondosa]|uniref:Uncharacterized protein n=1 Tax=Grifola frondosa TaxID=5627 RepID=A0A1C7MSP7_GRIFR|nr:hypothetical protein A0H81_00460 [Grifola frondosa]